MQSNLMLLLTAMIWGFAFVAQQKGMDYVGPYTFNAVRNAIGAGMLFLLLPILDRIRYRDYEDRGRKMDYGGKALLAGGVICGVLLAVATSFQQIGLMYTTVGKSGFITAMYIIIVPILGFFIGRRISPLLILSVVIAVVGIYMLCMTGDSLTLGKGDFLTLLCAVCFSFQIMAVDHFSPKVDGVRLSLMQFMVCSICCGIPALLFESPDIGSIIRAWMPVLYAGIFSCGIAYTLQIVAQKNTEPVIASLLMSLESAFSLLAGWIILHDKHSVRELFGCLIMFIAIILAQLPVPEKKKQQVHSKN